MRLILVYSHRPQSYIGGLLKRAAVRLGLDVVSAGPIDPHGLMGAPVEDDCAPDVRLYGGPAVRPPDTLARPGDVLINVDQGDDFYCVYPIGVRSVYLMSESNEHDVARARASNASVFWSCMPEKIHARLLPGLLALPFGWDDEDNALADIEAPRAHEFVLYGTMDKRENLVRTIRAQGADLALDIGRAGLSRAAWGRALRNATMTYNDHPVASLTPRLTEAMAAGCLLLSPPFLPLDLLAPRGYVVVEDVADVAATIRRYRDPSLRLPIIRRAQAAVASFSWNNNLLRILASVGVRP